jgi:outer membrane protein TolC
VRVLRPTLLLALTAALTGGCALVPPPMPEEADLSLPADPGAPREPLGGAPPAPALAAPVRLADLLPLLLARSPRVAAARARLEAAAQRRPQVVSLPDPTVEARYYLDNAMAPDSAPTRWELMVTQEIPLPWMLALRGEAADAGTKAAALRYEATVRDAVADLHDIHAERRYLAGAEAVQTQLRAIYARYADVARAGMRDGAARLPESFRAEALAAQAEYDVRVIADMRAVEDARLRALLALPPGAPLGPPADAPAVLALDATNDALLARALEWNQELRAMGADVEMARLDARMARWNYAPMPMVGVGKMFNDDYDMETGKTRDSTTVTFGVTLPIWRPRLEAGVREADANLRAARADESAMRSMLAADVAMTAFQVRTTARLAALYAGTLVPQAERAMAAADARVRQGEESLASSLELAATWQQLSLARLRAEADHVRAVTALERMLGTTARPAAGEVQR